MKINKAIAKQLSALGLSSALVIAGAGTVSYYEGKENKVYVDPVGILTGCYGHTGPELKLNQKFTDEECIDQLADDLLSHDKGMMKAIKVPITDYQHAAFLSFCYNVGVKACTSSTAFKLLNQGKYTEACMQLLRWNKAGGKVLDGLTKRRQSEVKVCLGEIDEIKNN